MVNPDRALWISAEIARYLVYKGSVAVEGISLTIAGLTGIL